MDHVAAYTHRPEETLLEKCARLRAELQATARRVVHANDNERERPEYWWQR